MDTNSLEAYVKEELKKYQLWSFLEAHGSEGSRYKTGYMHALQNVLAKLKECEQLTIF